MATIPLRDYCREIENMIDKGHTEEAIGHCRHILKHFPKHIDTYRLLGKGYLENRQLGDAADIFQRVLSSIPDDFVSHIGMSIIREDEGNLDAAIWHMERAFEVQSSNIAIQDELRRLYGNRDGQEPPKIRLTRGALAHLYANGNLYIQAIGELRAALATDPKRLDLQVLLAKMYFAEGQNSNAAKTASQLITKVPYCLEANRILVGILNNSERKNEAASYQTRVQELDPYYKHISSQYPTLDVVPAGVIVIETLDWEATKGGLISQPAWATSIGVDLGNTPVGEELPEWLSPGQSGGQGLGSSAEDDLDWGVLPTNGQNSNIIQPEEPTMEEDNNIPDWMKDSGWSSRNPDTPEEPQPPIFEDEDLEEDATDKGEIAKANIPDWLQALAPKDLPEGETDEETASSQLPDWLQTSSTSETAPSRVSQSFKADSQSWMLEDDDSESQDPEIDLPDWLADDTALNETDIPPIPTADMPDWLKEMGGPKRSEADYSTEDLEESTAPEWLQEISNEVARSTGPLEEKDPALVSDAVDMSTQEDLEDTSLAALFEESDSNEEEESPPEVSWFDSIEGQENITERSGVSDWLKGKDQSENDAEIESEPGLDIPDWLQDLGQEIPSTGELFQVEGLEPPTDVDMPAAYNPEALGNDLETELGSEDDAIAWVESLESNQVAKDEELPARLEDRQESALPSWLEEITENVDEEVVAADDEEVVPEWLRTSEIEQEGVAEMSQEAQDDFEFGDEEESGMPDLDETVVSEEKLGLESDDATMAWLESLAAKQGAKEEELLMDRTDHTDEVPEWLQGIIGEEASDEGLDVEELAAPIQESDMAELFEDEASFEIEEAEPDLSYELEEDFSLEMDDAGEPMAEMETEAASLDEDDALVWLESLAAKQGVDEEELLTPADQRSEDIPEWIQEAAERAREEDETAAEMFTEEIGDMDILPEVEQEQAEEKVAEIQMPELEEMEHPVADLPTDEEMDATWLAKLLEDEEEIVQPPVDTEEVPDWLTESAADFIAEAQEQPSLQVVDEMDIVDGEEIDFLDVEEESAVPDWLSEEESEVPALVLEEEEYEPPLPVEAQEPEEEADAMPLPVMEMEQELEPGFAPEPAEIPQAMAEEPSEALSHARATLTGGDVEAATYHYEKLIKNNQNLDEVIADITEALDTRYPVDIGLWQTLGDAHVRKNSLQDALDAYTKAEELLR